METKKWYLSKAMWGSLLTLAVFVLRMVGKEDVAATVEAESAGIAEWLLQAMALVGGAMGFYGTITRKTKVTL